MNFRLSFSHRFAILWTMNNRKQGLKRAELKLFRELDVKMDLDEASVLTKKQDGSDPNIDRLEDYDAERSALEFARDEINTRLNGEGYPAQVGLYALNACEALERALEDAPEIMKEESEEVK